MKNMSNVTWESGEVITTFESSGNLLEDVSGSIDKATVGSGEMVTLNMKFTLTIYGQFIGVQYADRITYNINYLVGEEIKTMVVIISFV